MLANMQKDEKFENAKRLRVNIGNIYFRKRDYAKAVKYYRMALDRTQPVHQRTRSVCSPQAAGSPLAYANVICRTRILGNIGVALVRLGRYEDAMAAFEECLDSAGGGYSAALNLILAAYCLDDVEKMREAFQVSGGGASERPLCSRLLTIFFANYRGS